MGFVGFPQGLTQLSDREIHGRCRSQERIPYDQPCHFCIHTSTLPVGKSKFNAKVGSKPSNVPNIIHILSIYYPYILLISGGHEHSRHRQTTFLRATDYRLSRIMPVPSCSHFPYRDLSGAHWRDIQGSHIAAGWSRFSIYPLVNVYITMERSTMFNGTIHYFYGHFL